MTHSKNFRARGPWFKDSSGRTMLLRGVNLSGSSKVPISPNGATWNPDGLRHHRDVSFVGRPFPLTEADEHFSRLKAWGLTFIRFLVTWEAIEHAGPGQYDEAYLDYLYQIVKKAGEYELNLFIDPHQDVWSRFTGGDGAPGWSLEAVGMNLEHLTITGAALTHQTCGNTYPKMIWLTNYGKFACATMFTLFFGGNDFAPQTNINGVPVQEFLQSHYLNAIKQVAGRLKEFPHVIGYDTLNEPSCGYIGYRADDWAFLKQSRQELAPSILEGMLLAAGYSQKIGLYKIGPLGSIRVAARRVNPEGVSLWREGYHPIWKQNGVWDVDQSGRPVLLNPDHFVKVADRPINYDRDYFNPFVARFSKEIRSVDPDAAIFVSPVPLEAKGGAMDYGASGQNLVHAPHWYDGLTLWLQRYLPWLGYHSDGRRFWPVLGRGNVRRSFGQQIKHLADYSKQGFGGVPTLIGETGIPYNLNNKKAYHSGDFSAQVAAMDDTIDALEANLVHYTLWNYTPDNTNAHGDLWNNEDLSIFSRDQQTGTNNIDDGGRALEAVIRPYPVKVPGEPIRLMFDIYRKIFEFEFRLDKTITAPAEFFVPNFQFPRGYTIVAEHGRWESNLTEQKLLYYPNATEKMHRIVIRPTPKSGTAQS